ncbi:fructose bisphosphate aldolase [Tessaracoccus caeni]|uniref:fructose bisphosphate aldolase n=1 Tax=Tessaracoccus caeni TaxID=3031239 RepID=UPI0023DB18A9|nr:fructose bisphosphate aldolase [Tessaracoccus caeni]MDF1488312.1 fructose bisphosphate aldolase [Tessaracoccus caeni]
MNNAQLERMGSAKGFIAALDQSGGSTPGALRKYGIEEDRYTSQEEMFDLVHGMRERIVTSPSFTGEHILGAILFEMTMDRTFADMPAADYLWEKKGILPILKVDKGLLREADGVQLMKPIDDLDELLERAKKAHIFGTKMRSLILEAAPAGIVANVAQQFDIGKKIAAAGLVPILEPEINIRSTTKAESERILLDEIMAHLDNDEFASPIMFKLTPPSVDDFYRPVIEHPKVLRVVALSGGYSRDEANEILARNHGLIASFSRALTEGLTESMNAEEFDALLAQSIRSIYDASIT